MANKKLFPSAVAADITKNNAGGVAVALSDEAALTQYVMTGTFNGTFYTDAETDLKWVIELARKIEPEYLARLAVFARERAYMKDAPALLLTALSVRSPILFAQVFDRVVDNAKVLRTFVQMIRSGVVGRKSLGSGPKRLVADWLEQASDRTLVNAVGRDPSIGDVIRLSRPKAKTPSREALFGYLIGKVPRTDERLPAILRQLEAFRAGGSDQLPEVEFRLLTEFRLTPEHWKEIARNAPWQMTRMNLNTFARKGVFEDRALTRAIAARLRDAEQIRKARAFPYQLLAAYRNIGEDVPQAVAEALIDAAEIATENVPAFPGKVYVMPDVSGSMRSPVTGRRRGSSSKVRCVDVAALVAATVLRRNPDAEIIPFEGEVVKVRVSARDSVLANAEKLAAVGGGSTNCSAPLALLNGKRAQGDLLIYVSDNESWVDAGRYGGTALQAEWRAFKARNPGARLACIDIAPNRTVQARSAEDVLNVGGFSDAVFDALNAFARGELSGDGWVKEVGRVRL